MENAKFNGSLLWITILVVVREQSEDDHSPFIDEHAPDHIGDMAC